MSDKLREAAQAACSVCNEVHSILDADESEIIRDAKDGYPEGRTPRVFTLQERVTALCRYASDWKRWYLERENTTPPPRREWVGLAEPAIKDSLTVAKPVAWMSTKMAGVVIAHQPEDFQRHPDRWQPLYAAQMLRPETEYICKCGLRVTPHRCKTDMEF